MVMICNIFEYKTDVIFLLLMIIFLEWIDDPVSWLLILIIIQLVSHDIVHVTHP